MSNPISSYGSPEIPLAGPRSALATATGLSTSAAHALMGTTTDGTLPGEKRVKHEYEVSIDFEQISIRKPTIFENNGAIHPMMPNDARLRNLTYAAPLNVDVKVTTTFIDHTRNGIRESNVRIFPNVHLGKIPVMVGSKYCLLHDQKHIHPSKLGECPEDIGGYFIIQGGERAMISMERMSENRPFVFRNGRGNAKEMEVVEIKCIGPDNDQVPKSNTVKIVYHPKNQLITMLRATVPRIKTDIPLIILFRALGVLADKDIYELIVGYDNDPTYDHIITESILEASSITTQEQALLWLAEHTNTWTIKSQKQNSVHDSLREELFPHIGGSDMNYEKACFLAHMTRKVLWTSSKRLPTDDRDGYSNKRVDIPGFLLADLFRKTYNNRMVKDMKAALSKEIHGGSWKATGNWTEIVNINNINKIIKSTILDVCLKSSLATGSFGSGKIGGPSKIGVSQVLNRLNYTSAISHLRRISTPIEKTGKLIAPRKQHNSQWGYVCVLGNTSILNGDGLSSTNIINMKDGHNVMTADPMTLKESPSKIHHYFATTPQQVLEIKTLSGRTVGCSPDHPLLVVRDGDNEWIHAGDLRCGDKIIVKNYTNPLSHTDGTEQLILTEDMIRVYDQSEKRISELEAYTTSEISEEKKLILARLIGAVNTDGTITTCIYGYNVSFYVGEEADAKAISADIERLGFNCRTPAYRRKTSVYNGGDKPVTHNYFDVSKGGAFASLLVALGGLVGHKGKHNNPHVPSWILNGSSAVKREFLSAFQGGDGCRIKGQRVDATELSDGHSKVSIGRTQQTCLTEYSPAHLIYMNEIAQLFKELDIEVSIKEEVKEDKTIHMICFNTTYSSIAKYASTIGYRYCAEKSRTSAVFIEYAMYRDSLLKEKTSVVDTVRALHKQGMTYQSIYEQIGKVISVESIRRFCTDAEKDAVSRCRNYITLSEFTKTVTQIDDKVIMPITEINTLPIQTVYDFTTESNNHDFYANGILVRNCPCETPEGHGVGVIKNMASTTAISIFGSPVTVYAFIQNLDKLVSLRIATIQQKHDNTRVFLNGSWIGILPNEDAVNVVSALRNAKRSGKIHIHTGIIWKNAYKELWITTEAGRVIRPVYYAPAIREIAADTTGTLKQQILDIKEWNHLLFWETPTEKHLFEYLDAGESEGAYIAMDYDACVKDSSYTHCEIHPSVIFGTAASGIPFPDHNQSPRNAYQCLGVDEKVRMADGTEKRIADVKIGDKVITFNPNTMEMSTTSVCNQYVRNTDKLIYTIKASGNRTLIATEDHKLMTNHGWTQVKDIIPGIHLLGVMAEPTAAESNPLIAELIREVGSENVIRPEVLEQWKNTCYSMGGAVFVPVKEILLHPGNIQISDITVLHDNHSFITTGGILSSNCAMGKQAMGIYSLNFRERFDAMSHILCYPEIPMVSPYMSKFYGAQSLPAGQNIVVAIMTYTGYNQEDSNMINRGALDRGRYRSIFYRTYKDEERKNQSSGEEEKFCNPDSDETKHMKNAHYEKLAEDGFVPKNQFVTPDDVLIGKVVPLRVATGAVLPAGAKKQRDVSKMPRNNESGYVDKVYKNRNGEGYSFVKIRVRKDRIPEIGDKFSCYSDDTDILTDKGWINFKELTMDYKVASLMDDGETMTYTKPLEVMSYDFKGNMYKVESNQVDLLVTPNHRMYVGNRDGENFGFKLAEEAYGKRWTYKKNIENYIPSVEGRPAELSYINSAGEAVAEPQAFILKGDDTTADISVPINDWLLLFGIWMAEGCISGGSVRYAAHKERVRNELDRIGLSSNIKFGLCKDSKVDVDYNSYRIYGKVFVGYFTPLSVGSTNKSLPEWTWYLTPEQCRTLINGMMLGDGHTMANGTRRYDTSSIRLANDFQRLCLHAGYSTNISIKYLAGHESVIKQEGREGEIIKSTVDAYRLTIIESQNTPKVNKNITKTGENRHDSWQEYDGKVYCCRVDGPGAIYVRRNKVPVWSGNSRHGQKGTMGMILNPEDMPQTASGIIPDIIINPHAIPSRMTIAQLMETLLSKIGCMTGCLGDGSPFNATTVEDLATILRDKYGMEPHGNEIMYNGYTGRMMETSIFVGPCYYQRLRHCAADKQHSRASGPLVMLTRQPAEGRARDGGLRFGEMERDCVVAHGMAEFTKERLMECSDMFSCYSCKNCGLLAIANPEQSIWACRGCGNTTDFSHINIPYATKLLLQELETMNLSSRLITQQKLICNGTIPSK